MKNFPICTGNLDPALIKGILEVDIDSDSVYDSASCACNSMYIDKATDLEHLPFLSSNNIKVC